MAAAELQSWSKMSEENNIDLTVLKNTVSQECNNYKDIATDFLVMRDFTNCHQACLNGISFTKQHPEEECAQTCMESLCVLCIQALAEMNRWPAVLPLVQDTYNGIETCPYTVIQLCLLLHAKVNEFSQCYAIASIWLRCKDNIELPEYKNVVMLYIKHVMIPQDQLALVPQFLNSCTTLSESEKENIMHKCEKLWSEQKNILEEQEDKKCSLNEENAGDNVVENSSTIPVDRKIDSYKESGMIIMAKRLGSLLTRHMSYINIQTLFKIAIVSIGLCLLARQTLGGDLLANTGRGSAIWQGTLKILTTMFTPYRPGR